jgi:transposase
MAASRSKDGVPRRPRRRFTAEFKAEAVRLLRERQRVGESESDVARELGLSAGLLHNWAEAIDAGGRPAPMGETMEEEVRRLRRENATLKLERDFAKKAAAFFARESQ